MEVDLNELLLEHTGHVCRVMNGFSMVKKCGSPMQECLISCLFWQEQILIPGYQLESMTDIKLENATGQKYFSGPLQASWLMLTVLA